MIFLASYAPGKIYLGHGTGAKGHGADTFFIASKRRADTYFCSLQPWVGYFFSTTLKPNEKISTSQNSVVAIFTEIADSDWNAVAPIEVNWKKNLDTARSQYSEYYES